VGGKGESSLGRLKNEKYLERNGAWPALKGKNPRGGNPTHRTQKQEPEEHLRRLERTKHLVLKEGLSRAFGA